MIPPDLPNFLLTGAPAIYCAGLLLGFDSLMQRRSRTVEPKPEHSSDLARSDHNREGRLLSPRTRGLEISVADSPEAIAEAVQLIQRRYAWRGYQTEQVTNDVPGETPAGSHEVTLLAKDHQSTLGTLTLRLDSPHGLRADAGYGDAVSAVRAEGRRVCELTRLALAETSDWKAVLASLFSLAYAVGRTTHGVTDVFIEVNPRHVGFYQRALGFVVAAGERICERVQAPSVLLKLELADLERRLRLTPPAATASSPLSFAAAAA